MSNRPLATRFSCSQMETCAFLITVFIQGIRTCTIWPNDFAAPSSGGSLEYKTKYCEVTEYLYTSIIHTLSRSVLVLFVHQAQCSVSPGIYNIYLDKPAVYSAQCLFYRLFYLLLYLLFCRLFYSEFCRLFCHLIYSIVYSTVSIYSTVYSTVDSAD